MSEKYWGEDEDYFLTADAKKRLDEKAASQKAHEQMFFSFLGLPEGKGKWATPIGSAMGGGDIYEVVWDGGQSYLGYRDGVIFRDPQPDGEFE